jgi:putative membrane protein
MNHIIKIFKGSLVGLGSILPGISGSMVATILKIYTELITALNQFTKKPIKAILSVWQYIVGVLLGYLIGFLLIKIFLENFPIPFTLLFIGFIIGSIPSVTPELKDKPKAWHHYLVMGLAIIMMVLFLFVQEGNATTGGWTYYLVVFMIGFITAASLITPGLSAATLLMALGYFHLLISLVDDVFRALVTFNFSEIMPYLPMLFMLIVGVLVGMIVIGKVMYQVLMHFKVHFYMAVLGIILISPFNILFELQSSTESNVFDTSWITWVAGIILFGLGFYVTYRLSTKKIIKGE